MDEAPKSTSWKDARLMFGVGAIIGVAVQLFGGTPYASSESGTALSLSLKAIVVGPLIWGGAFALLSLGTDVMDRLRRRRAR